MNYRVKTIVMWVQHLDGEGQARVVALLKGLPQSTVLVVSQAHSVLAGSFDLVDWVIKQRDGATLQVAEANLAQAITAWKLYTFLSFSPIWPIFFLLFLEIFDAIKAHQLVICMQSFSFFMGLHHNILSKASVCEVFLCYILDVIVDIFVSSKSGFLLLSSFFGKDASDAVRGTFLARETSYLFYLRLLLTSPMFQVDHMILLVALLRF